ncbi:hypothetical protein KOR42_07330 [Thalassoglobus neptunius]|uniref:Uncharacterized protein n=1 Tax=Thalassoglobus neptunius TaxID=1938619 RepID=A0A5C5X551_9PLAN|nr:hypothetical protein KOR42_07330 [Thalassoglobus neptunius]
MTTGTEKREIRNTDHRSLRGLSILAVTGFCFGPPLCVRLVEGFWCQFALPIGVEFPFQVDLNFMERCRRVVSSLWGVCLAAARHKLRSGWDGLPVEEAEDRPASV